jgi:hypothetical protein
MVAIIFWSLDHPTSTTGQHVSQAADEIDRLRAALQTINDKTLK